MLEVLLLDDTKDYYVHKDAREYVAVAPAVIGASGSLVVEEVMTAKPELPATDS